MREYADFIADINNAIENIESFVGEMGFEQFEYDSKTHKAVIRCLEEIGEGVKHITDDIKKKYPDVPWKEAAGLRDKLIHYYWGVDLKIVWNVIKYDLPILKQTIDKVKL